MKNYLTLFALLPALFLQNCKKDECTDSYTVSGKIINGTTMQPKKGISLALMVGEHNLINSSFQTLGSATTDSKGFYSISYKCTDVSGDVFYFPSLPLPNPPKNQNSENNIFYWSDSATLKININTNRLLVNETLFVGYNFGRMKDYPYDYAALNIDTVVNKKASLLIHKIKNGLGDKILWGRGNNDYFIYNNGKISGYKHQLDYDIKPDPAITEVTINY